MGGIASLKRTAFTTPAAPSATSPSNRQFQRCYPPLASRDAIPPCTSEISTRSRESSISRDIPLMSEMQPPIASRDAIPTPCTSEISNRSQDSSIFRDVPQISEMQPPSLHVEMLSPLVPLKYQPGPLKYQPVPRKPLYSEINATFRDATRLLHLEMLTPLHL